VLLKRPEDVIHVEHRNAKNYAKATMLRDLVGDGILMSEGEKWRRQRRLIQPRFHPASVAALESVMIRRIDAFLHELDSKVIDGEFACDLGIRLKKLVFEIILESLFGEVAGHDFEELLRPMEFVNSFLTYRFNEWVPLSLNLPFPKYLRFQSARRAIDRVIQRYVDRKRQEIELGHPGSDLLTQMILSNDPETGSGMDSTQIRDETVSILLAGFETTGNLLSWMIGNLGTHPAALERLQVEIDSCGGNHALRAETVLSLPYLSSVVEETLRLNPPVWAWTKRALEKDVLGDFEIKKGQILFLSPYLVHRDPSLWKDPNRFDPDRWTPELREATKGAYFPFGLGPRTCVGKHFALLEAKLILVHFLSRFGFRLLGSDPLKPEFKITLGLESPLKVALQRRSMRG
jgi:cytochrome P450